MQIDDQKRSATKGEEDQKDHLKGEKIRTVGAPVCPANET